MSIVIVPTAEEYFEGMRQVLDTVAREKRFLAFLQAPPVEEAFAFYRNSLAKDHCHFVAVEDDAVVGWCDIQPTHGEARAHVGTLGIALAPAARHRGIGSELMKAVLAKAGAKGLSRIELTVRTDNLNAKALYKRFGFAVEGIRRRDICVDGEFFDTYAMALIR
jgi:putative acetyltransferase